MKGLLSRIKEAQDGAMALEACISLTLFLIVMLALYSILQMFTAQSMIAHAAQEACQSIALENYNQTTFATGTLQQVPSWLFTLINGDRSSDYHESADFSLETFLFKDMKENDKQIAKLETIKLQTQTEKNARRRFAAYLAGNEKKANELLKNYGVVNGLDGISFKGTEKSSTDMTIQIAYTIRLNFYIEMFHFGEFESTQKVCSRLWK